MPVIERWCTKCRIWWDTRDKIVAEHWKRHPLYPCPRCDGNTSKEMVNKMRAEKENQDV